MLSRSLGNPIVRGMSGHNEPPQGSRSSADGYEGPSSSTNQMSTSGALSRRESRNASNWPDASPLHHNEGTSYFQQGRTSPTLSRRMHPTASAPGPSSYQRQHSRSQQRSASITSARLARRDTAFSEEEEDDNGDERRESRDGRRTPGPRADEGSSSSDDPEAEAARVADLASDAGSLDPVTLYVSLGLNHSCCDPSIVVVL